MAYERRTPRSEEIPQLVDLLNLVFCPTGSSDMGKDFPTLICPENLEHLRIIVEDGKIVAHVGMTIRDACLGGIPTTLVNVGSVATHPEWRGKGYATELMADAVQHARTRGADIMLISGGRGLYRRMRAVDCGSFPALLLGAEDAGTETLSARQATEDDLPTVAELRQREPVRYQLPMDDLQKLFRCKSAMCRRVEWWLFSERDQPVGFGVVAKEIRENKKQALLIEWNGHPEALRSAWATWHKQLEVDEFRMVAVTPMNLPLCWRSCIKSSVCFDGTVLILHARRLLERARPWIAERLDPSALRSLEIEADETSGRFTLAGETLRFQDGGELAELLFGVASRDIIGERTRSGSPLQRTLRCLFPIPLVWYGLAFV